MSGYQRIGFVAMLMWISIAAVSHVAAADERRLVDTARLAMLEQALEASPDSLEAGNEYRHAAVDMAQYDRALAFFKRLVEKNPDAANAHLNYGFAYVDKIPTAGAITQVILANNALNEFKLAVEKQPTWLAYYTLGNSYLFWPTICGRAPLGIENLQHAIAIQQRDRVRQYHVRTFIALGDGYWKIGRHDEARRTWSDGAALFPDNAALRDRLSNADVAVDRIIEQAFDPTRRVDTDLSELWGDR